MQHFIPKYLLFYRASKRYNLKKKNAPKTINNFEDSNLNEWVSGSRLTRIERSDPIAQLRLARIEIRQRQTTAKARKTLSLAQRSYRSRPTNFIHTHTNTQVNTPRPTCCPPESFRTRNSRTVRRRGEMIVDI